MLNIVIPMAGRGSRFSEAGYVMPKPLIDIYGHYMIEYVVKNIKPSGDHRFIFICQQEHIDKYNIDKKLKEIAGNAEVVAIDHITEGAACTVLLATEFIDNDDPMVIANSDQYVDIDIDHYYEAMTGDGLIMTMPADDPKWSFIKYNEKGHVTLVREKEVISKEATVGIYNFGRGSDFVKYANRMIEKNIRVNNEFYVAPVYNEMIADGKIVNFYDIGNKMYGLGTPEDLNSFIGNSISKNIFG